MFERELKLLLDRVRGGKPAHLVSSAGMGATVLLRRLGAQLESEGYVVLHFSGSRFAPAAELLSVHQAGYHTAAAIDQRSLSDLIDWVARDLAGQATRVILLDDLESIDPSSLVVIQAAAQRTETPVVFSRSASFGAMVRSGVRYTLNPGVRVELRPLDFVAVAALVQDRLGHQPDSEIISRVYAKSGGITALALAIIDGAVEGHQIDLIDERWVLTAPRLWSSAVDAWLETRLAATSPEGFEALTHLALAHDNPRAGICTRFPESILTALEGQGLLSAFDHPTGFEYVLHPPALSEFLRRGAGSVERAGQHDETERGAAERPGRPSSESVALSVRTLREGREKTLLEQSVTWKAAPCIRTALPYFETLLSAPRTDRTLHALIDGTSLDSAGSAEETFDFLFLKLLWEGKTHYRSSDFEEFLSLYPAWQDAIGVFLETLNSGVDHVQDRLEPRTPGSIIGRPGEDLAVATVAYACLVTGRTAEARHWLQRIPPSSLVIVNRSRSFVDVLIDLAAGDSTSALEKGRLRLANAHDEGDHGAILLYSYAYILALLESARWQEALDVADHALAFGPPGAINIGIYRVILCMGACINWWSGKRRLSELFIGEARSISVADQPIPWAQEFFTDIVEALIDEDPTLAMERVRFLASRLEKENSWLAAVLTLRFGLTMWPEQATAEALNKVAEHLHDDRSARLADVAIASFQGGTAVLAVVERLSADDQDLPLVALMVAARARQGRLVPESAAFDANETASSLLQDRLAMKLPSPNSDATEPAAGNPDLLSKREREIVLLAGSNSNPAIASLLGLSVRTVESHIYNALKKTGSATRQDLYALVRA